MPEPETPAPPPPAPTPPPPPKSSEKVELFRSDNKCGKRVQMLPGGGPVQCNPYGLFPCCSALGWCGNTLQHCNCPTCMDYRTHVAPNALPAQPASPEGGESGGEI